MRLVTLVLLVTTSSCGSYRKEEAPAAGEVSAAAPALATARSAKQAEAEPRQPPGVVASAAPQSRKIIRRGELRVVVKTYEPARSAIEEMVRSAGGYISSSNVNHSLGHVSSATLVLRVPAGKFAGISHTIARLGTLTMERMDSEDISDQYFDLKARLSNARKLEARLLELMAKQANRVKDLLEVERELSRVREKIERFEGKLRLYDQLVALSTLTVHLSIQQDYVPPKPPSFGDDVAEALAHSWASLKELGRGLVLVAVALVPWTIPIVAVVWLLVRLLRRRRRRRAAQ